MHLLNRALCEAQGGSSRFRYGALLVVPTLLLWLALLRLEPPVYSYYANALLPVPMFAGGFLVAKATRLLSANDSRSPGSLLRWLAGVTLVSLAGLKGRAIYLEAKDYQSNFQPFQTLDHAQKMAHLINEDRGAESRVELRTYDAADDNNSAYYFLMPGNFYHLMDYHEFFHEILLFSRHRYKSPKIRYVIVCPRRSGPWISHIANQLSHNWQRTKVLDTMSDPSTRDCSAERWDRRVRP